MKNAAQGSSVLQDARRGKRTLAVQLAVFCVALSIPITFLLFRVYRQLTLESLYNFRSQAEEAILRINRRAQEVLGGENARPFEDYSYYRVQTDPLLKGSELQLSPLAALPAQAGIQGLVGYFQIDPQGRLTTPVLPAVADVELEVGSNLRMADLKERRRIRSRIEEVLFSSTTRMESGASSRPHEYAGRDYLKRKTAAASNEYFEKTLEKNTVSQAKAAGDQAGRSWFGDTLSQSLKSFSTRQETVQVAEPELLQEKIESQRGLQQNNVVAAMVERETERGSPQGSQVAAPGRKMSLITTFQASVDPLQLAALPSGQLAFYRRVWRDNQRFIQGFIVESGPFLSELVGSTFQSSPASRGSSLTAKIQGQIVGRFAPAPEGGSSAGADWVIPGKRPLFNFTTVLDYPLDALTLSLQAERIPASANRTIVAAAAVLLYLVLYGGTFGVYRLGARQIEIAKERSDFVSAVSHELRTPLTSIRMYSEMLRSGFVSDQRKLKEYYDYIFSESERLSRLIGNVLQLARLANHIEKPELVPLTVEKALDLISMKIESQMRAARFEMMFEEPPAEWKDRLIAVEEDALTQIFINLADNAVKFSATAEPKELRLGVRILEGQAHSIGIFVRDFGPGVEPAKMKRIFELFYRAEDPLTRKTSGTGIGLALVKELAGRMEALVDVENRNPGAEFSLWFRPLNALK